MHSEASDIALALLLGVAGFWLAGLWLRLAGHRLYWLTFWALVMGLQALALYRALVLWLAAMVLELIVFIALKIRDHRRSRSALQGPAPDAVL